MLLLLRQTASQLDLFHLYLVGLAAIDNVMGKLSICEADPRRVTHVRLRHLVWLHHLELRASTTRVLVMRRRKLYVIVVIAHSIVHRARIYLHFS